MSEFWLGAWSALAAYMLVTTFAALVVRGDTHTYEWRDVALYFSAFLVALVGANLAYLEVNVL